MEQERSAIRREGQVAEFIELRAAQRKTSDSNPSILVNSVTAFFDFMRRSLFREITHSIEVLKGVFELNVLQVFGNGE